MEGKLIIFSAPSGAGKTSIIKYLLDKISSTEFSISATSREPRENEKNGIDYHFMSVDSFKKKLITMILLNLKKFMLMCFMEH